MCWYERRLAIYLYLIDFIYSPDEKTAPMKDENGRELPNWLQEAEEKILAQAEEKLPKTTNTEVFISYAVNYSIKAVLLY